MNHFSKHMENRKLLIKLFKIELALSIIQFLFIWPSFITMLIDYTLFPRPLAIFFAVVELLFLFIFPVFKFRVANRMNYYECAKIYWWRGQRNWAVYNVCADTKGSFSYNYQISSFYLFPFSVNITKTYSGLLMLPFFELYEVLGCIIILNRFKKGKIKTWDFNLRYGPFFRKDYGRRYKKLASLFGDRPDFNPNTKTYDEIEKFYDSELGKKAAQQFPWYVIDKAAIGVGRWMK